MTVTHWIPEAAATPLHDLDLVRDSFGESVGDGVIEVVKDLFSPPLERAPGVEELWDARGSDLIEPQFQSFVSFDAVGGVVDGGELLLEHPGDPDLMQCLKDRLQCIGIPVAELGSPLHERPGLRHTSGMKRGLFCRARPPSRPSTRM